MRQLDTFLLDLPGPAHDTALPLLSGTPCACLYHAGEAPDTVYWLRRGAVELVAPTGGTRRVVQAPALLPPERLTEATCRFTARLLPGPDGPPAAGVTPADIRRLALPVVRICYQYDPEFRLKLLRLLCRQLEGWE